MTNTMIFETALPDAALLSISTEPLPFRLGPDLFECMPPVKIKVMIVTLRANDVADEASDVCSYKTSIIYLDAENTDHEADEILMSHSADEAQQMHERACNFFGKSKLFRKI